MYRYVMLFVLISQPSYDPVVPALATLNYGFHFWDKDSLKSARAKFRELTETAGRPVDMYLLALTDYRLTTFFWSSNKDSAKIYLEEAVKSLEEALDLQDSFPDAHALLGSLYGMKIAFNWAMAPILGPKSGKEYEKAISQDSLNPRIYLFQGISNLNTPPVFGGGADKALKNFKKSIKLFTEGKGLEGYITWGFGETYVWLGKTYLSLGDTTEAKRCFSQAEEIEPQLMWAKSELKKLEGGEKVK